MAPRRPRSKGAWPVFLQVDLMNQSKGGVVRTRWKALLIVFLVLAVIRIVLPFLLLRVANSRLASIPGYYGHIDDLDLALIRGAYSLDGFYLDRVDSASAQLTPFLSAVTIDLSVEWTALLHGALVGEVRVDQPALQFTKDKAEPDDVQRDTASLGDLLKDFMPLQINRLVFEHGRVLYRDEGSVPPVALEMTQFNAVALNLRSVMDKEDLLPASVKATASVYGGNLRFDMSLAPLSRESLWDLDLAVEGADLTQMNDFFQAYADIDVNKGVFSAYCELATREGAFKGYIKPLVKDLDVLGAEDRADGFFRKVWEGVVGGVATVLRNPRNENVGTKIPLEGRLNEPDVRTWVAIIYVLRNAFIQALTPDVEGELNIQDLKPSSL